LCDWSVYCELCCIAIVYLRYYALFLVGINSRLNVFPSRRMARILLSVLTRP